MSSINELCYPIISSISSYETYLEADEYIPLNDCACASNNKMMMMMMGILIIYYIFIYGRFSSNNYYSTTTTFITFIIVNYFSTTSTTTKEYNCGTGINRLGILCYGGVVVIDAQQVPYVSTYIILPVQLVSDS